MMIVLKISSFQKSINNGTGIVRPVLKNWLLFDRIAAFLLQKTAAHFLTLRFTVPFSPFLELLHV